MWKTKKFVIHVIGRPSLNWRKIGIKCSVAKYIADTFRQESHKFFHKINFSLRNMKEFFYTLTTQKSCIMCFKIVRCMYLHLVLIKVIQEVFIRHK